MNYLVEEGRDAVVASVRQQPVSWLRDLAILALLCVGLSTAARQSPASDRLSAAATVRRSPRTSLPALNLCEFKW